MGAHACRALRAVVVVAVVGGGAQRAAAHIELEDPPPRYSNTPVEIIKHCPCGGGPGDFFCGNGVTTDVNRDPTRVTTFTAGQTITVKWAETVAHPGRARIAFAPDGADEAAFDAHVLLDVADPDGRQGAVCTSAGVCTPNPTPDVHWQADVVLLSTPCTNCVLQLIQAMDHDTATPVTDVTQTSNYFQCADIVLVAAGEGEGEGEGEGQPGGEGEGEGQPGGEGEGEVVRAPRGCGCAGGSVDVGVGGAACAFAALALSRRRGRSRARSTR